MKKILLTAISVVVAIASFATTSSVAESMAPQGNDQTYIYLMANRQPVYVHNSFGTFGFSVTGNPYPVLNVSSSYASMSEISIVCLETNQHLSDIHMAPHKGSVPVFGNGSYMVTVKTNMGTFYTNIIIYGLPNYEPGDPHIPMPIDDPVKIKY